MRRLLLLVALPVLAALLVGFAVVQYGPGLVRGEQGGNGEITIGGPFALTDAAGHTVTAHDFAGRWMLVYFGYTHCPDVCPTTLNTIALALAKLPAATRARIAPLFITVDPDRDTPTLMGAYARAFDPQITGLSGTPAEISAAEQEYHVYAQKHPIKGDAVDYDMDHSSVIYVMKPDGSFDTVLSDTMTPADMAKQLQGLAA